MQKNLIQAVLALYFILIFGNVAARDFVHPGLLHSQEDLNRMRDAVADQREPIYSGFKILEKSSHSAANYRKRGPFPEWGRAPNIRTGDAQSDAQAAYQNALMWAITGKKEHARKSIEIVNAWANTLKKVSGIDGVLASGIQGIKFANAAEILRYTDSGWTEAEAKQCEKSFKEAWLPTIEHYAYFANGNWETAALQTKMAIAVFCNDEELFEETVRYAVDGAGNGSIPHMIVYPSGQCQETTRAQHYAQLGIGLLGGAVEIAWNQGVDLYGWNDNHFLKGYEYTAKYGLGEDVPYQHYLDRTGKYGKGGRHQNYTKISTLSRGNFYPIFERTYNHYSKRRNIAAPHSKRVVHKKRPEGYSHDYVGLGTLTHWRPAFKKQNPQQAPGAPAGIVAKPSKNGIHLTWVRSVDPLSHTDATSYSVLRSPHRGGPYRVIATQVQDLQFEDREAKTGELYYYQIKAHNKIGISSPSYEFAACRELPGRWKNQDIGNVQIQGHAKYNGKTFTLEGEGKDIGGTSDQFHFVYAPMTGQGTVTARIVNPMSGQWSKLGVMMRSSLDADSKHASVLLLPHWSGALVTRRETGGDTSVHGTTQLGKPYIIKKNRIMKPYWVRIVRFRNQFTGYMSGDGYTWKELGTQEIDLGHTFYVGLPACSQMNKVTTRVTYDNVSIPTWRMPHESKIITARPIPRWHKKPWLERHLKMNERARQGNVDLIMIGDSITHWWDKAGKKVWDKYYAPRNALNLAISGDRTEHVLWRLENGNIEGISPKLATVMIGTNNHMSSPPEVTARDIRLIVQLLRRKLPKTKILVLAIFPRGGNDDDGARQINMKVNELIKNIGDDKKVFYANINQAFLNGRRMKHDAIPDGTHPNEKGYQLWAEAMEPLVKKLMGEE